MEVEQTGIITKHFKKHKLALLKNVFAAVAVLDLKFPNTAVGTLFCCRDLIAMLCRRGPSSQKR